MAEDANLADIYDEVEIDDLDFEDDTFYYPCPCGDRFRLTIVSHCS